MNKSNKLLNLLEEVSDGIYVGIKFTEEESKNILNIFKNYNISNMLTWEDIHVTLMYDVFSNNETIIENKLTGKTLDILSPKYELFGEEKDTLVVSFSSELLEGRHEELKNSYSFNHSYDVFKPHITISNSVDKRFDISSLPKFSINELTILKEYSEKIK